MRNRLSRNIPKAFVLDVPSIQRLCRALGISDSDIRMRLTCADGSNLVALTFEEIADLPNPLSRAIEQIGFKTTDNVHPSIEISFGITEVFPISYTITGDDSEVIVANSILQAHLEPLYRRWSFLSAGVSSAMVVPTLFVLCALMLFLLFFGTLKPGHPRLAGALSFAAPILSLTAASMDLVRKHIFPRASFLIGDGLVRYRSSEVLRNSLGIGAAVSLLVGLLANYLSR